MATSFFGKLNTSRRQSNQWSKINIWPQRENIGPSTIVCMSWGNTTWGISQYQNIVTLSGSWSVWKQLSKDDEWAVVSWLTSSLSASRIMTPVAWVLVSVVWPDWLCSWVIFMCLVGFLLGRWVTVCFCDVVVRRLRDIETSSLKTCISTLFAFTSVLPVSLLSYLLWICALVWHQCIRFCEVPASLPIIHVFVHQVIFWAQRLWCHGSTAFCKLDFYYLFILMSQTHGA